MVAVSGVIRAARQFRRLEWKDAAKKALSTKIKPPATAPVSASEVPGKEGTIYPKKFAGLVAGRSKAKLGDFFGLSNFGVNRTTLKPGSSSALLHNHQTPDEFVYILEGEATLSQLLVDEDTSTSRVVEKTVMKEGDCVGFPFGSPVAHCISNESSQDVSFLEIGDRSPNDSVAYPTADLKAFLDDDGAWKFLHKDDSPYES
mmetsp:Transcript_25948/g.54116  ORF Transcript_25948/g.54116 Transcript_25948/m.54116 type:complete len:202 (-) Transcript_25948:3976-4581(-)